ncbi:MAG TPA: TRAP transporter small permease subunit [Syntrophomonas sp.]|nr:TRAP transporter small permease subunit [Syntrophomonas sp.]
METIRIAKNAFDKLIEICAIISTIAIVLIMFLNVIDTICIWLEIPVYGIFELNGLLVGINLFLGLALVQKNRKHVTVKIIGESQSYIANLILTFLPYVMGSVFFSWLTYICWGKLIVAIKTHEVIQGLVQFPLWPLKSAFAFGMLLLTIQLLIDLIMEIHKWRRNPSEKISGKTADCRVGE